VGRLESKVEHLDGEMSSLAKRLWNGPIGD
jgi:hypothetical protein